MEKLKMLNGVTARIIMEISEKNNFSAGIAMNLRVTYSHTTKILNDLEENKIINRKKAGRKVNIELTKKGLSIQKRIKEIKMLI